MASTSVTRYIRAPRGRGYAVEIVERSGVALWRVPDDMTCDVLEFNRREGGTFQVSLTYFGPLAGGKSGANIDRTTVAWPASFAMNWPSKPLNRCRRFRPSGDDDDYHDTVRR